MMVHMCPSQVRSAILPSIDPRQLPQRSFELRASKCDPKSPRSVWSLAGDAMRLIGWVPNQIASGNNMLLILNSDFQDAVDYQAVFKAVMRDRLWAIGSASFVLVKCNLDSANVIVRYSPMN